ncbi:D-glycerate dehydrogenase [Halobacteriales archaeon QS_8_69_26]|nr:MAG: D-glycerate dehydrogenase [Halobacteriales archaeon QS_8_69_26]
MTARPVVYVTREIPDAGLDPLADECEVHVHDWKLPPGHDRILRRLAELEADGLLCLLTDDVDGEVMDASPNLRVVSTFSVGYDHVDVDEAERRGIAVGHTPGVLSETTADFTWALLMTAARRTVEGNEYVLADEWETWGPKLLTGPDVHHATLGVVGLGNIGATVARRAAGFEMEVLYANTERDGAAEQRLREFGVEATYVELDELLARSDFVTLHVPLNEATEGLIGDEEFEAMPDDAVLVNTSRGPVVDTDALDRALADGSIKRAALDVTDPEPLPGDHPVTRHVPEKLVLAPHIASASIGTRDRMARMAAENMLAGLRGESLPNSAVEDRR